MADRAIDEMLDWYNRSFRDNPSGDLKLVTERIEKYRDEAEAKLKSLVETMMAEVVGEDEDTWYPDADGNHFQEKEAIACNELRNEQRQRISQVTERYFGEDK